MKRKTMKWPDELFEAVQRAAATETNGNVSEWVRIAVVEKLGDDAPKAQNFQWGGDRSTPQSAQNGQEE